jgi:hypothetical protein
MLLVAIQNVKKKVRVKTSFQEQQKEEGLYQE